ncbi:MAG TPA: hypothetical protein VE871_13580 [Longimicrobium sp.]|nr:hypothetical protein [Longimicrobium sp.]
MTVQSLDEPLSQLVVHQLHAVELRQRAAMLREHAEQARERALRALASTELRRRILRRTRETTEFAVEQERGTQELAAYITGLRREQELLRAEAALQQEWFREQALAMLNQGWGREELAEIGFGDAFLADLGLQDAPGPHPSS